MVADRPTYNDWLAASFLAPQVEKKFLRGESIRFGPFLTAGAFLFETGCILGYAFRDHFDHFIVPFGARADAPGLMIDFARDAAMSMLDIAKSSSSFAEALFVRQMRNAEPERDDDEWSAWLAANGQNRVRVPDAIGMGKIFAAIGTGFGHFHPDIVADLYRKTYLENNPEEWRRAYHQGVVDTPELPEYPPLDARVEEAKAEFAEFCREYHPERMAPLGLVA